MSLLVLAELVLVLTPLADPARLSVNSQVARLLHAAVAPDKFDYAFLRYNSGRYGHDALATLTTTTNRDVRARASRMQATSGWQPNLGLGAADPAATEPAFSHATVYPPGEQLPADFKETYSAGGVTEADCLKNGAPCDIYLIAYGGSPTLIVRPTQPVGQPPVAVAGARYGQLYQRAANGTWQHVGTVDRLECPEVVAALRSGQVASVPPEYKDLLVNGIRVHIDRARQPHDSCAAAQEAERTVAPTRDPQAPAHMGPAFSTP